MSYELLVKNTTPPPGGAQKIGLPGPFKTLKADRALFSVFRGFESGLVALCGRWPPLLAREAGCFMKRVLLFPVLRLAASTVVEDCLVAANTSHEGRARWVFQWTADSTSARREGGGDFFGFNRSQFKYRIRDPACSRCEKFL